MGKMNNSNARLSFVIPCYGSEKTIEKVINEIEQTVEGKNPYEIICVNDCSPDNVYEVLKNLALTHKNLKVVCLAKNYGQHNALMAGYRHVTGDIIISLDDDGQTPPSECYKLIDAIDDEHDIIYAKYADIKHSPFRRLGSDAAKQMGVILCDIPKHVFTSSYFAVKRFVIDEVVRYQNPYTYISGLFVRATRKIGNVEVTHHQREVGRSGYSLKKLVGLMLNGFTAFSVKPLRFATVFGSVVASLGFLYALFIVIRKIIRPEIAVGYSSLMCVLLVIGGIIMMMLGLIGEYLGRIYICMNNSPQYVIRETINIEENDN